MSQQEQNTVGAFKLADLRLAVVLSQFNSHITMQLKQHCIARMQQRAIDASHYAIFEVPGAIEIPLAAQSAAVSGRFDAIIALGAVIRGETSHYDVVCQQVAYGCQRVMLDHKLPIIFAVITADSREQAQLRCDGTKANLGADAVDQALQMLQLQQKIAMHSASITCVEHIAH